MQNFVFTKASQKSWCVAARSPLTSFAGDVGKYSCPEELPSLRLVCGPGVHPRERPIWVTRTGSSGTRTEERETRDATAAVKLPAHVSRTGAAGSAILLIVLPVILLVQPLLLP